MINPCVNCTNSFLYDPPAFPLFSRVKLYSNNALVFYKVNSQPASGQGTVRNSRAVARRT